MSWTSDDLEFFRRARWELDKVTTEFRLLRAHIRRKAGYDPNQPRIPVGTPGGGRWSGEGGNYILLAQNTPRGPRPGNTAARWPNATPGQQAELVAAQARADAAIARVRERLPNWQPTPSFYETINGAVSANRAMAAEAESYLRLLQDIGIGPGRYADGYYIVRRPGYNYSVEEININNRNGYEGGCHTCGVREPGTKNRNWIHDHQDPTSLNILGKEQRVYPQCAACSARQGGWIRQNKDRNK